MKRRSIVADCDPFQQAAVAAIEIGPGMNGAAVIPDKNVARLPPMRIHELLILGVIAQFIKQRAAFSVRQLQDAIRHQATHEQRLTAGLRNRPDS